MMKEAKDFVNKEYVKPVIETPKMRDIRKKICEQSKEIYYELKSHTERLEEEARERRGR